MNRRSLTPRDYGPRILELVLPGTRSHSIVDGVEGRPVEWTLRVDTGTKCVP